MNKIRLFKIFLLILFVSGVGNITYATPLNIKMTIQQVIEQKKVTINISNKPIRTILYELQRQSGISFIIKEDGDMTRLKNISLDVKNVTVKEALDTLLKGTGFEYVITEDAVTISRKKSTPQVKQEKIDYSGKVIDNNLKPVAGATVIVVGTTEGAITDESGAFSFKAIPGCNIEVTYVGFKPVNTTLTSGGKALTIRLESDEMAVDDVVVTGIYSRKKESFTGSSQTYSAKNLKSIGNQNILKALGSLDPSFAIIENNQFGSDPNRMPDIEVRGKTSVIGLDQEFGKNLNQPLFILDGFETTLTVINDLSMDMIENVTILKDAAAAAIYGSKAANGVVVVETKRPATGKFRISYNGNFSLNFADLSDYNLMNSSEKLSFELMSGYYGSVDNNGEVIDASEAAKYNMRKAEVARGVDTYWMDLPLRTSFTHKHTLFAEGGDEQMRYGVGFSYGNNDGVMIGSGRETMNGNVRLMYKKGNVAFTNYTNIDYSKSTMEKVSFSEFSRANPYLRKYDELGDVSRVLESFVNTDFASPNYGRTDYIYNPEYNRGLGSFYDRSSFGFRNNFEVDWQIVSSLRARGRFSVSKSSLGSNNFKSPLHTDFAGTDQLKRGSYAETNGKNLSYDGDFNLIYSTELKGGHNINAVAGYRLSEESLIESGYNARGFIDDSYANPAFSTGYTEDKPKYTESVARSMSYYFNGGYTFKNKYLLDVNIRYDGSSAFGLENKFDPTWAVGLAWNLHKEKFMESVSWIDELKLRASIGNPGNQNFTNNVSSRTYRYNNSLQNPFGLSAIVDVFGNPNLEWQKTIDKNIGLDAQLWDGRIKFGVDVFNKVTDPLLVYVGVASSTGSVKVPRNMGKQVNNGVTAALNVMVMRKESLTWSVNLNARHLKSKYDGLGSAMNNANMGNRSLSFLRYYDGASTTALWSVPSAGIDAVTGREIFVKKDGTRSFVYDYNDEVVVGNQTPDLEGVFGTTFYYKGFSASINFRYRLGGEVFMKSLYDKVENISKTSIKYNQDKRALYDRWQKPGDNAKYRAISLTDKTQMSSRFVETENMISAESISLGYETQANWLRRIGASSMTFKAYMNDIFRVSTIKNERGIDYPFARSVSFSLGLRF